MKILFGVFILNQGFMKLSIWTLVAGVLLWLLPQILFAQNPLQGTVAERGPDGRITPLPGATVYWLNTQTATSTDENGRFTLPRLPDATRLIASSVGYRADTLDAPTGDTLRIFLESTNQLQGVTVSGQATVFDRLNPIQTEILTTKTLAKAACCNLSESFETNASVSVSYADAVTGARQIQMLGLSGNYVQINTENIPNVRGLNTTFGLNYTPGTWISSIDVAKGIGSVVNGYEAMTGAINVELIRPDGGEKLYVNGYLNGFGRGEINLNAARTLSPKWSVGLLSHASTLQSRLDKNGDGFLDLPLYSQVNGINRWKYQSEQLMAQFGVKALYEDRTGGQLDAGKGRPFVYEFGNLTRRVEAFSKTARLFPNKPYQGLGLIMNALVHDATARFGFKTYAGQQRNVYANLIYQNILSNTNHQYKAGISYLLDAYNERYTDSTFRRTESVPGLFVEYTETIPEKLTLVLGLRADFHNLYGTRLTPRLHLKYDLSPQSHLRIAAGKGWRVPNPIAENFGMLVNSRVLTVLDRQFRPEESWNYGFSLTNDLTLFGRPATVVLDAYRTDFQNQLIVDMESSDRVRFYNLRGKSFSNSFQAEVNAQPIERLDLKLAYRWFDVQQSVLAGGGESTLLPKMFVNRDRVLFNVGYATKFEKWKFDFTWQWNGRRRIPDAKPGHEHTASSPPIFAPAFANINAQITKNFLKWSLYVGGENLGNFTQKNPIIAPQYPFGQAFDASMTWGPVIGRMIYVGMRFKIKD